MGVDIAGLGAIATAAKGIADKLWPDKTELEKAKIAAEVQDVMNEYNLASGQQEINKIEAANPNMFIAGPRPAVLWICAVGFAYAIIVEPLIRLIATIAGYTGAFPEIDSTILMEALFALLGIGGMRSFEKYHGVENARTPAAPTVKPIKK
jgi:hypothetical protein